MISDKELYDGFSPEDAQKIRIEAEEAYGKKAMKTSEKYLKRLTETEFEQLKLDQKTIFKNLLGLSKDDIQSEIVQLEIAKHYHNIRRFWGTVGNTNKQKNEYRGVAKLYLYDDRFTLVDGKNHTNFPIFISDAMEHFAKTQL